MSVTTVGDIASAAEGISYPGDSGRPVSAFTIDSRKTCRGDMFFALSGSRSDGHDYVADVLEKGAVAVVSKGPAGPGRILVNDVLEALSKAARWRRGTIGSTVIGLTGSCGKTTTRKLLTAALATAGSVHSTKGNLNNHIGLPLTILNVPEAAPDYLVLEMGMNHAGELLELGDIASPDHCLVTNIRRAHMEFFRDLDQVAAAKAELLRRTATGGICVIPGDNRVLRQTAEECRLELHTFGPGEEVTLERHKNGWKIIPWGVGLELSLPGAHNAVNAMAALLMARCLGADISSAAEAVNGVTAEEGRGRIVRADNIVILDESYNANPDSTRACLTTLDSFEGPRAAVLGDMLELGDEGPAYHEEILKMADGMELEFLILTGPIYGSVCRSIMKTRTMTAADWKEALELLRREAQCGCTVLVKGSHSIGLDRLVSSIIEGEG